MKIRQWALLSFVISILILFFGTTHVDDHILTLREILNPPTTNIGVVVAPEEHRRPEDQTFLTFPEWFLVFSPAEYATFVKSHPPSEFPFFGHIAQFWHSYRTCLHTTLGKYPFNWGYNVMILVIGTSTTVEYSLRGAYEAFIGRFTDIMCPNCRTQEDEYGAMVAQDYVDFIRLKPWYEYNFNARLKGLWQDTDLFGPHFLRKIERKYILSSDYFMKAIYGWIIKKATKASYDEPISTTMVLADKVSDKVLKALPDVKKIGEHGDGLVLLSIPRYQPFTQRLIPLAESGSHFIEIAGNRGDLLMSLIAPSNWRPASPDYSVLFTQPILTEPTQVRVALVMPIEKLGSVLSTFSKPPFVIEHIFDY
jgi:hypothetical protein